MCTLSGCVVGYSLFSVAPCRMDPCRSHLSGLHGIWRKLSSQLKYRHAAQVRPEDEKNWTAMYLNTFTCTL